MAVPACLVGQTLREVAEHSGSPSTDGLLTAVMRFRSGSHTGMGSVVLVSTAQVRAEESMVADVEHNAPAEQWQSVVVEPGHQTYAKGSTCLEDRGSWWSKLRCMGTPCRT